MKVLIIILLLISTLFSVSLPVDRPRLTSTFGESRRDHFHNGVDYGGGEQNVKAIQDGKIIFYSDQEEFPFDNYYGSGNYAIIDHDKTRSYYMHLKNNSINKTNYNIKEKGIIGRTSDTGHSYGIHLHFTIEKKQPIEILNPLTFFKDQFEDKVKPKINGFFIKIDDSKLIPVHNTYKVEEADEITLYLSTYDLIQNNNNKMGPYKITCYLNDEQFSQYLFDKLIVKNNYYYLVPNYSFQDIYHEKYIYILGKFPVKEKSYSIKVVVEDFLGNQAEIQRKIEIKQ